MGWLDKMPWRKTKQNMVFADMLNGYTPIFSQFGQNIYTSDVVQQALMCIVTEMKKLNLTHVITSNEGDTAATGQGSLNKLLQNPNELMTKSEFLEKITWSLLFNYNAFIIPVYDIWTDAKGKTKKNYTALYPVQPNYIEFLQDPAGTLCIKLKFSNDYETTLPYSEVIHWRHNFSVNEFLGGNEQGQPNNDALLKTLELNNTLLQGVSNAMKSSFAINGVVKYNTLMDDGKTEIALKSLEKKLLASESGFLPLDLKAEFIPIKKEIKLVDADTLKFIDEKILRNWGISLPILTGDFNKDQYEAFYQKVLEGFIITLGDAFTKTLFSDREKSYGNRIKAYPKDLVFMSVDQTLEMIRLLGDSGALYENEKRVALGLKPLQELNGVRKQSLNYVDVNIANSYQLKNKGTEGEDGN
ncbi:Phage portal protein [uncultured Clostridium sp.]